MGNLFDEDEEGFDLAAIEARHAEMEAQETLDKQETGEWEAIVEAVLFTMGNSVEVRQLAAALAQSEAVARQVADRLKERYEREERGMQILALEDAYQMCTKAKYYEHLIRVAAAPKKHVLTEVVLETLSIIAYKQPVTKMEISRIRGVSSDHAVNRLVEYGLVYEAGRLDAPGRPALFATTEEFLRRFGVSSTQDLPTMNPEQEEEIIQEVEEELQMKLNEGAGLAEAEPASGGDAETEAEPGSGGDAETEEEPGSDGDAEQASVTQPEPEGGSRAGAQEDDAASQTDPQGEDPK